MHAAAHGIRKSRGRTGCGGLRNPWGKLNLILIRPIEST